MGILVDMGTFLMNREDIIRMAREASNNSEFTFVPEQNDDLVCLYLDELERFAALIASAEREACAKICVDESWRLKKIAFEHENLQANSAAIRSSILAEMIRARGQA